jgi:hypothetical protein
MNMKTYNDYYNECMAENPTQTQTINGEEHELSYDECCQACADWATMKVEQDQANQPTA